MVEERRKRLLQKEKQEGREEGKGRERGTSEWQTQRNSWRERLFNKEREGMR